MEALAVVPAINLNHLFDSFIIISKTSSLAFLHPRIPHFGSDFIYIISYPFTRSSLSMVVFNSNPDVIALKILSRIARFATLLLSQTSKLRKSTTWSRNPFDRSYDHRKECLVKRALWHWYSNLCPMLQVTGPVFFIDRV